MARARNIKPKFFTNEELVELPFSTRLLFIGLWTLADRLGRLEDRPKRIKMDIFPADPVDVEEALSSLQKSGFLLRYETNGERYIQILAFSKHQNPHKDEKKSEIPAPCEHSTCTVQDKCSIDANRADSLNPDSLNPESNLKPPAPAARDYPLEFVEAYGIYPRRPGMSKADAFKAWQARVKSGVAPDVIRQGVARYAAYCARAPVEPQFIKMPSTFFGPGEHYLADWAVPKGNANGHDRSQHLANVAAELTGRHRTDARTIDGESVRLD